MRHVRPVSCVLLLVTASCNIGFGSSDDASGVATVFDSSGDTIVARVVGDVPAAGVRSLVAEVRIAPGEHETTLFTEVFEFDVDRSGRFWIFDQPTHSIFLFGPDGVLERRFGGRGSGPGEFARNGGMVILPSVVAHFRLQHEQRTRH